MPAPIAHRLALVLASRHPRTLKTCKGAAAMDHAGCRRQGQRLPLQAYFLSKRVLLLPRANFIGFTSDRR